MEGQVDVCVVGGGIAGLSAARILRDGGASVAVLEARDRVGGRTYSTRVGNGTFDLGGQWLGPTQHRMLKLVGDFGLETFPTYDIGRKVLDIGGRRQIYKGTIPKMSPLKLVTMQAALSRVERMAKRIPREAPWEAPDAARLDATTVEAMKNRMLKHRATRGAFDVAVETVFGAHPSELSALYFLHYANTAGGFMAQVEVTGGAQETRFVDGAQQVSLRLAGALGDAIVLGAPVRRITQDEHTVTVRSDGGEVRARHCVVAMPPVMAGRIEFDPPLPALRDQLTQAFPMGATIKCHVLYDEPFWRADGLSGEAVFTEAKPVSVTFDNSSHDGAQPALVAFVVGRQAREMGLVPMGDRRAAVLEALVHAFGPRAREAADYLDKDWAADPWTRGCPTAFMPPGALTTFGPAIREPVGRIHWAGTETATEWSGYMEGAVQSAERAAAEILGRM